MPAFSSRSETWAVICGCGIRSFSDDTEAGAIEVWNARHQSGRTGAGEALREALNDSQSTLSAIKAECIARTEQEVDQMASHIAEICQITMLTNAAALSQSTAGEDPLIRANMTDETETPEPGSA